MAPLRLPSSDNLDIIQIVTKVRFQGLSYNVVFTAHAKLQMGLRQLTESEVFEVIQEGDVKPKEVKNKFWVFMSIAGRKDNFISVSISIESPRLIVITTMINWRPR